MNVKSIVAIALTLALASAVADARGYAGGGARFSRPAGGFDFHNDGAASRPPSGTHSSTGPYGTQRTTNYSTGTNGYSRNTTATNGNYTRTSGGSGNYNTGNVNHYSSASNGYGSRSGSTSGNVNTGNVSHNGSGSNPYGSYSTSGSGNAYNRTYSGSATATNAWGQTYHSNTYVNNGYVYHGAVVTNPVYYRYPTWGWNGGVAWYPAPYYYGGGFWGPFAVGVASAAVFGSIVAANNVTYTSYEIQPESPGAKLLASYQLTQTPCGPPGLVVIYGPNNSVICAHPNNLVAAGNYSVNSSNLTIVSENPAS
jgi:hypothetical protein